MKIKLRNAYSFCQLGRRGNQEDSRYPDADTADVSTQCCFAVCDGVGGAPKGEEASSIVAEAIGHYASAYDFSKPFGMKALSECLGEAYEALDRESEVTNSGMATTMTMIAVHAGGVTAAHIGDSRIYHIRPGHGILYRSKDHSLVDILLRRGKITPEEAENHPQRNIITRCMSPCGNHKRNAATATLITDIMPGDVFILASDGVLHCVSDKELCRLVDNDIPEKQKTDFLAEMCKDSIDNNTLWMITVDSVDPLQEKQIGNRRPANYVTEVTPAISHHPPVKKSFFRQLLSKIQCNDTI